MILVYFPSGGCDDDVFNNRTNYQLTSIIVVHFKNWAGVCWISVELILMCASV